MPIAFVLFFGTAGGVVTPGYTFGDRLQYIFWALTVIPLFYTVIFIVTVPHWVLLIFFFIVVRKKIQRPESYLYVVLGSNILIILLTILFTHLCRLDSSCYTDGPLGSGYTVIGGLLLSFLFGTLPFVYVLHRISLFRSKRIISV